MRKTVLTVVFILLGTALSGAVLIDRRADFREAAIEARYPPKGRMVRVDGKDVHVVVKGSGPALVLIHGAGGNAQDFTFQMVDRLADRYTVFAVDRPGLGWSEPIGKAASPEAQARHLARATRMLGAEDPIVLGHSYGGAVALAWAVHHPGRLSGLVTVAGASHPWETGLSTYYRVLSHPVLGPLVIPLLTAFVPEPVAKPVPDDQKPAPGRGKHQGSSQPQGNGRVLCQTSGGGHGKRG